MTGNDDNGPKKGPWGQKGGGSNGSGGDNGQKPWRPRPPAGDDIPDIDDILRHAHKRFNNMFEPRQSGNGGNGKKEIGGILLIVLVLWLCTGLYRVLPGENAVVLTFGKWTATRVEAGLGYHIPWPVQTAQKVNVAFDRRIEIGFRETAPSRGDGGNVLSESQMLTGDENIVDIDFVVMWRIADAKDYLFRIRDPETTIKKVAESAMREIVGREKIQRALTEGRADIEGRTRELMQKMLDDYQSGVTVNSVQLLRVDPPSPVVDAFDDVQRARADMERTKNEAETYRNEIVPRARGEAQKIIRDAEAYKEAVLSKAKGDAARFDSVYNAYAVSKDVTTTRMYIETMEKVMLDSRKVIVGDGKAASAVLPYLPLEQGKKPKPAEEAAQ